MGMKDVSCTITLGTYNSIISVDICRTVILMWYLTNTPLPLVVFTVLRKDVCK